jgi:hypothetical protein
VSAKSILQSGTRHFFNLSDPEPDASVIMRTPLTVHNPVDTVNDAVDSDLHLGGEAGTNASQEPFEHVEFGLDRANDGLGVWNEQHAKKSDGS